jgi:hypothetical protein
MVLTTTEGHTMNYTYTDYDAAIEALRSMERDVEADMGEDAVEAGFYDLVHAVAMDCSPVVKKEILRTQLGEGVEF